MKRPGFPGRFLLHFMAYFTTHRLTRHCRVPQLWCANHLGQLAAGMTNAARLTFPQLSRKQAHGAACPNRRQDRSRIQWLAWWIVFSRSSPDYTVEQSLRPQAAARPLETSVSYRRSQDEVSFPARPDYGEE